MTWDKIIKATAAVAGAIAGLLGEWNTLLTILVIAMATDYITGLIVAACGRSPKTEGGRLSSTAGFIGLAKKAIIMAVVLLATLLDKAIGGEAMVFQTASVCYYIANEGLSILENAALLDVPIPRRLRKALEALRDRNDEDHKDKPPDDGREEE